MVHLPSLARAKVKVFDTPSSVRLDATDQTDAVSVLWLGVAGDVTGLGDGLFWSKVFSLVDG